MLLEYEDSNLYLLFITKNPELLRNLLSELKYNFDLNSFYNALTLFNTLDKELAQELLINIDPRIVTDQLLTEQDEMLVINTFISIASTNGMYLYYSLQADFTDFIKWLEFFLTKVNDLEVLALFLVAFQKIFTDAPELPLIFTTVVKKLQRVENLDDLGAFLGIIGSSDTDLLQTLLNNLLPHLKLYPTDKLGYLLMTTSLYNMDTGIGLVKNLSARFSSEYDLKLLRKSIESIILANAKVAEILISDKNFNKAILKKNIKQAELLEKVLFLETILPVGKELINEILEDEEFVDDFFSHCFSVTLTELTKVISNSNWLNEDMCEEVARCASGKSFNLEDYYTLIHTSSWSNRSLCKKIIYWTNLAELGEKIELADKKDPILDKIIGIISEVEPEKAEKLIFDYIQDAE